MLLRLLPTTYWNGIWSKWKTIFKPNVMHFIHLFWIYIFYLFKYFWNFFSVANQKSAQNCKYSKCLTFSGEINKEIARFSYVIGCHRHFINSIGRSIAVCVMFISSTCESHLVVMARDLFFVQQASFSLVPVTFCWSNFDLHCDEDIFILWKLHISKHVEWKAKLNQILIAMLIFSYYSKNSVEYEIPLPKAICFEE